MPPRRWKSTADSVRHLDVDLFAAVCRRNNNGSLEGIRGSSQSPPGTHFSRSVSHSMRGSLSEWAHVTFPFVRITGREQLVLHCRWEMGLYSGRCPAFNAASPRSFLNLHESGVSLFSRRSAPPGSGGVSLP